RLRHPGRDRGRQRRARRLRDHPSGRRAGARRRRPDADRIQDFPHEGARRARRRRLRAQGAVRGVEGEGSDRAFRAPPAPQRLRLRRGSGGDHRQDRRSAQRGGRLRARFPHAAGGADVRGGLRLMATLTYLEAIRQALWDEMEQDERVFMLGQDIGTYGGAFRVTAGFLDRFGGGRIVDTPISESAMIGAALGAAVMGMLPVVEMQFIDFISCGFNQIINFAAPNHYRWGQRVPIVVRGPAGGNVHGSCYHSQNPASHFQHTPGLKIVAPGTVADAYGLLRSAIQDPNPVLYFEHKYLYRRLKDDLATGGGDGRVPIGEARLARAGRDLSVITYGAMLQVALEAAGRLEADGIDLEVL